MFELLNSPYTGVIVMPAVIAGMNYYIRKYQVGRVKEYYNDMVRKQDMKTSTLTCQILTSIRLSAN